MPPTIAFSTLACPEWPLATVVERAAAYGYDGVEWRGGIDGHVNPGLAADERASLRQHVADAGLFSLAVTAYTSFLEDDPADRQANVDLLRRYLDLASDIGAGSVRAFLGELPPGAERPRYHDRIVEALAAAVPHATAAGVAIGVEPHDDFVCSASVSPILARLPYPPVAAVWDFGNAFFAGEDPAEGWSLLGRRLAYVQVKDGVGTYPSPRLTPLSAGEVPLGPAIELALRNGYTGAFSLEWERAWHPEIDPAEVALPAALRTLRELLARAEREAAQ
jgi:sugar phosphate isomerase/epimerase